MYRILPTVFAWLLTATLSHAQSLPPVHSWVAAYNAIQLLPTFESVNVQLKVAHSATGGSPLQATNQGQNPCLLLIRTNGHPLTTPLETLVPAPLLPLWQQTLLVHELAHCWRWQQHPFAFETEQADEIFADIAALTWAAQVHPSAFQAIHIAYKKLRTSSAMSDPQHPPLAVNQHPSFFQTQQHPFAYALTAAPL